MKISKKLNDFVYFTFPFISGLKKLLHFLHFKLRITLVVYNMSYLYYFESLVNEKFSNLKLNFFIITGFICNNKYVKQVVLGNHSWISPTLQTRWGLDFCLFSKEIGEDTFSPKKGRGWKNSGGILLRESNLCLLLIFVFINPRNITIQGIYKSNKL